MSGGGHGRGGAYFGGSRLVEKEWRGQEASVSHPGCADAERGSGEQPGDTRPRDQ